MQRVWRGAAAASELSTGLVCSPSATDNIKQTRVTGRHRQDKRDSQTEKGWGWKIHVHTHTGRWQENLKTSLAKLEKEKTASVFLWVEGEVAIPQAAMPPYLLLPMDKGSWAQPPLPLQHTHTHTSLLISPKAPRCGSEASAPSSWREITFESGCYLWRIRLYWPEEMTCALPPVADYRPTYTLTAVHTGRWHQGVHSWLAVLTLSWRQIWLAGWLASPPPPLLSSLLPYLYPFTQHDEIFSCTACHSGWQTTCS